jgi:hypothetical protein
MKRSLKRIMIYSKHSTRRREERVDPSLALRIVRIGETFEGSLTDEREVGGETVMVALDELNVELVALVGEEVRDLKGPFEVSASSKPFEREWKNQTGRSAIMEGKEGSKGEEGGGAYPGMTSRVVKRREWSLKMSSGTKMWRIRARSIARRSSVKKRERRTMSRL